MNSISVVISSYGEAKWDVLAQERPYPSVIEQGFHEVVINHSPDSTLAEIRNEGARQASGDYICFVDADDALEPEFSCAMDEALQQLARDTKALLTPAVKYFNGRTAPKPKIWPQMDIRDGNWLIIGTLVPRKLFLKVGGFKEYGLYEDWALWGKCINAGAITVEVPDAIYVAYVNQKSRNRSRSRATMNYWHQAIGHDNWPDYYPDPAESEHQARALTGNVRKSHEQ